MEAINSKNQSIVNKAMTWLEKYNKADDLRNIADGDGDGKAFRKHDRECEKTFDKFLEYMSVLPKNQQSAIYKSEKY